jgi:DNA polymerase-3 subunit alpha
MAAILATNVDNKDKIALYIEECRKLKIEVLPPDVNESEAEFSVQNENIRFGLAAIKNCGRGVVDAIIAERKANGPFKSLLDFCERVLGQGVGKSNIEFLIKAGAFGSIHSNRAQLLAALEDAVMRAQKNIKDRQSGQVGLFGELLDDSSEEMDMNKYSYISEFDQSKLLAMERDLLGLTSRTIR